MAYRYKAIHDCTVDGAYIREGEFYESKIRLDRAGLALVDKPEQRVKDEDDSGKVSGRK